MEAATKVLRSGDLQVDFESTLARSCGETTIQAPTKLLRLDLGEAGSTLARSCGETTIQPPTKVAAMRRNSVKDARDTRDTRDSASEGHTMAERDLGSTLRLPAQHPPLYSPDRVRIHALKISWSVISLKTRVKWQYLKTIVRILPDSTISKIKDT